MEPSENRITAWQSAIKLTVHLKPHSVRIARTLQLSNETAGTSWDLWAHGQVWYSLCSPRRSVKNEWFWELEPYASELCAWYMHNSTIATKNTRNVFNSLDQLWERDLNHANTHRGGVQKNKAEERGNKLQPEAISCEDKVLVWS